ncbi:MAG: extracellular solute-binding protein, partial [Clostridiales bacterium]|nr:extracellular solute-binding protein [Clostridiales bacterium]
MRKIAAILLAACMLFALGACGGNGGDVAGKDEFLGLQDGEEFTTDKEISLKFTRPKGNAAQEDWWEEAIKAFNTAYAGRIKVTADVRQRAANNTYESQIGSLNKAGKMPDVLYMDGPYVSNWAHNGMIIPLDNYITQTYLADFMDNVIDQGTYNDRLYALSIVDSAIMVFYRKEIMNEFLRKKPKYTVGKRKHQVIALPTSVEDAWTFDELADIAKQMRTDLGGGKTRYGLSISGDKTEWMSYAFTPMWGGDMLGEDTLTAAGNINSAKGYAAANYLRNLVSDKCINPDAADTDFYSDAAAGTDIKASMYLTGTQNITQFNQSETVANDWSATYYPRVDGQDYA